MTIWCYEAICWSIERPFWYIFVVSLVYFSHFGLMHREKSGNPGTYIHVIRGYVGRIIGLGLPLPCRTISINGSQNHDFFFLPNCHSSQILTSIRPIFREMAKSTPEKIEIRGQFYAKLKVSKYVPNWRLGSLSALWPVWHLMQADDGCCLSLLGDKKINPNWQKI
jgi:hypothetical protein